MTRRDLLGRMGGILAGYKLAAASKETDAKRAEIGAILARIQPPSFLIASSTS